MKLLHNNALERTAALSSCRLLEALRGQFFGVQAARRTRGFHPAQYLAAERGVMQTAEYISEPHRTAAQHGVRCLNGPVR